jgi:hypothetical protein
MEFNLVATGIKLIGTTVRVLNIENNIVDVEREAKRIFNLNINEPKFEKLENEFLSQMIIDFKVEIEQSEGQKCKIEMSLEGAFLSGQSVDEAAFKQLVVVNGAAAIIGIARGKIETISATVFNNGKIVIPFVNVVDYYKSMQEEK